MNAVTWDGKEFVAVGLDDSVLPCRYVCRRLDVGQGDRRPRVRGRATHLRQRRGGRPGGRRL